MSEWLLSTDDLAALWLGESFDRFPSPLRHVSAFTVRDEVEAHRRVVRDRYRDNDFADLQLALRVLGNSRFRIEILGGSRQQPQGGPGAPWEYRIVGARNDRAGVELNQLGTADQHSRVRVRLFKAEGLPSRLVKAMHPCQPGARKPETFQAQDLRPQTNQVTVSISGNSPRERYERLVNREADGGGSAVLLTGPIHTRNKPERAIRWTDYTGDGRYLETRGQQITIRPATTNELVTRYSTWIDDTLSRR